MSIIPWHQINPLVVPKYTLFIGPKGSLNNKEKKSRIMGGADFFHLNAARYSWLEAVFFVNRVEEIVDKGRWFTLTATSDQPYEMLREFLKYRMPDSVFFEQVIRRWGDHA